MVSVSEADRDSGAAEELSSPPGQSPKADPPHSEEVSPGSLPRLPAGLARLLRLLKGSPELARYHDRIRQWAMCRGEEKEGDRVLEEAEWNEYLELSEQLRLKPREQELFQRAIEEATGMPRSPSQKGLSEATSPSHSPWRKGTPRVSPKNRPGQPTPNVGTAAQQQGLQPEKGMPREASLQALRPEAAATTESVRKWLADREGVMPEDLTAIQEENAEIRKMLGMLGELVDRIIHVVSPDKSGMNAGLNVKSVQKQQAVLKRDILQLQEMSVRSAVDVVQLEQDLKDLDLQAAETKQAIKDLKGKMRRLDQQLSRRMRQGDAGLRGTKEGPNSAEAIARRELEKLLAGEKAMAGMLERLQAELAKSNNALQRATDRENTLRTSVWEKRAREKAEAEAAQAEEEAAAKRRSEEAKNSAGLASSVFAAVVAVPEGGAAPVVKEAAPKEQPEDKPEKKPFEALKFRFNELQAAAKQARAKHLAQMKALQNRALRFGAQADQARREIRVKEASLRKQAGERKLLLQRLPAADRRRLEAEAMGLPPPAIRSVNKNSGRQDDAQNLTQQELRRALAEAKETDTTGQYCTTDAGPWQYKVLYAGGVAVRDSSSVEALKTGEVLARGEKIVVIERIFPPGVQDVRRLMEEQPSERADRLRAELDKEGSSAPRRDLRIYLRVADGKGWVFDDSLVHPEDPTVTFLGSYVAAEEAASREKASSPRLIPGRVRDS